MFLFTPRLTIVAKTCQIKIIITIPVRQMILKGSNKAVFRKLEQSLQNS